MKTEGTLRQTAASRLLAHRRSRCAKQNCVELYGHSLTIYSGFNMFCLVEFAYCA